MPGAHFVASGIDARHQLFDSGLLKPGLVIRHGEVAVAWLALSDLPARIDRVLGGVHADQAHGVTPVFLRFGLTLGPYRSRTELALDRPDVARRTRRGELVDLLHMVAT